ncbi:MAG: aspartate/glutamate racemase family protein [Thermodesulfobacteriota bacterium]
MIYRGRPGQYAAGEAIGILLLDCLLPLPPGDVANATTFSFPVRYKVVKAASIDRLIYQRDLTLLEPFIEAARDLIREGVKAVTSDCGFMALFQKEMANALEVPVFLSSLLQIPFIHRTLRHGEKVGVIAADGRNVTERHMRAIGWDESIPIKITGMENSPNFYNGILAEKGYLDFEKTEAEVVAQAKTLTEDPLVKAILLECSNLPPYAAAVQEAVNLPVYDFTTLINHVFSALVRRRFQGFV